MSTKKGGRVRDKWKMKSWVRVVSPSYFGETDIGLSPSDEPAKMTGRVIESTLYDITGDLSQQYLKLYFQVTGVKGSKAETVFKGHEYSRDYLRSLVRRGSTRIDVFENVSTGDGYTLRVSVTVFTVARIKASQEDLFRAIIRGVLAEKAKSLTFDQFVQEAVLGKIASDVYNKARKISPIRHVGVRKSKLVSMPKESKEKTEVAEAVAK